MTFAFMRRATSAMILGLVLATASALPSFAATIVTVNGTAISDVQVDQRLRLFNMEGNKTGRKGATDQLITEAIQMTEAKRLGINVSNAQVDEALLQIARNLKVSQDRLIEMLGQGGVSADTLKDRLRAAIAWNAIAEQAVVPNVQISDLELDQQAAARLADYQGFDYILKEIVFVGAGASGRTAQANKYRSSFAGCDSAVQLSRLYRRRRGRYRPPPCHPAARGHGQGTSRDECRRDYQAARGRGWRFHARHLRKDAGAGSHLHEG